VLLDHWRIKVFCNNSSRRFVIIREWRGRAAKFNPEAYPKHFRSEVVPELSEVREFLGALLSRRNLNEKIEFLVLTKWQSMDAIRAFAGDAVGKAVVEQGAVAALVDFDDRVQHYETIVDV
jgi:heme-degrading monooxygenase HmoA